MYWNTDQHNILDDLLKEDTPLFTGLKDYLKSKGLNTSLIYACGRKDSAFCVDIKVGESYKIVPSLTLLVADKATYLKFIGDPERMGLLRADFCEVVLDQWKELCERYGADTNELYDQDMYVNLLDCENLLFTVLLKKNKSIVRDIVFQVTGIRPQDIYANSQPTFEIVFKDEEDYRNAKEMFCRIADSVEKKILIQALTYKDSFSEKPFEINFWHPGKQGYNGYGLARED